MLRKIRRINSAPEVKTVFLNFISLLILKGGNYIFPLIYLPYLINVLGVSTFGLISFAESIMLYLKALVDYGFDLTGTRDIANNRGNVSYISKKITVIICIKVILVLASALVLLLLISVFPLFKSENKLYIYSFLSVVGYALIPTWYFQGIEKMKFVTILFFVARSISTFSLFLFVKNNEDYLMVPLLNGIGFIVAGFLGMILMIKSGVIFGKITFFDIKTEFKSGFSVFMSTFAPNLYNNSMTFFIGIFGSKLQVGYYSAAVKLIDIANSLIGVLSNAVFPFLNRNFDYHNKLKYIFLLPSLFVSTALLFGADLFVNILYGHEQASDIVLILKITSPSPFFIACMSYYGTNYLLILKKDVLVKNMTIIFSLIGFVAALFLIPIYYQIGASIVLLFTRMQMAFGSYFLYYKNKSQAK